MIESNPYLNYNPVRKINCGGNLMRKRIEEQLAFGQVDISQIKFNPKSRDDIPQVLRGLQHIYSQLDVRNAIFQILEENVSPESDKRKGRPGMALWRILVMGVLRLNLNWDYDRLHEMVNHHATIRQMLGHTPFDQETKYNLQTIKDNVSLLTVETLLRINEVVVECAHEIVKKKQLYP